MLKKLITITLLSTLTKPDYCPIPDKRCESCNKNSECTHCYNSFFSKISKTCNFSNTIKNCKMYKNAKNCLKCSLGFVLLENTCQKIEIENCAFSNSEKKTKKCFICENAKLIDYGGISCSENNCTIENCEFCTHLWKDPNWYEACFGCFQGYSLGSKLEKCFLTEDLNCEVLKSDGACDV